MKVLYTGKLGQLSIADKPLASGGEGAVHKILLPLSLTDACVKIYHIGKQTATRKSKLEFMVANPPSQPFNDKFQLCWPTDLVFDAKGEFVGFIMPLAFPDSIQLYELATIKIKKDLFSNWHIKYNRDSKVGFQNRLKLCVNVAIALHALHESGNYVLVDFKPQNLLLSINGRISVTDLDSLQIATNKKNVIFPGKVATPEYTPREGEYLNPAVNFIPEAWDRFSLAVTMYEVLLGIHPYTATASGQYSESSTIDEKIRKNLFVHGSKRSILSVIPLVHSNFLKLPNSVKLLFMLAFEEGSTFPTKRPTAAQWGETLYREIQRINKPVPSRSSLQTANPRSSAQASAKPSLAPPFQSTEAQDLRSVTTISAQLSKDDSGIGVIITTIVIMVLLLLLIFSSKKQEKVDLSTSVNATDSSIQQTKRTGENK